MLILKNIRVRESLLSIMQDVRKLSCKHILQWKFRDSGELIAVMVKTDRAPFLYGALYSFVKSIPSTQFSYKKSMIPL